MTTVPCSDGCGRTAKQRGLCRPCYSVHAHNGTLPAAESYGAPTLPDLSVLGITYRQLDYWARVGYLKPSTPATGSGSRRLFDADELAVAARMGRLVKAGIVLHQAARIARHPGRDIDIAPGIYIQISEPTQPTEATAS